MLRAARLPFSPARRTPTRAQRVTACSISLRREAVGRTLPSTLHLPSAYRRGCLTVGFTVSTGAMFCAAAALLLLPHLASHSTSVTVNYASITAQTTGFAYPHFVVRVQFLLRWVWRHF